MTRISRREALRLGAGAAGMGLIGQLAMLQRRARAAAAPGDYRALVCVFLYGGNDGFNLIVPTDPAGYGTYADSRKSLALPNGSLLPIAPANPQNGTWGLHSGVAGLRDLFAGGKLAVVGNVGTLVAPTTKAQVLSNTATVPPQLFSHYDQSYQWMTGVADAQHDTGWCGRVAENLAYLNPGSGMAMNVSLDGTNRMQIGSASSPYALWVDGPIALDGFGWGPGKRRATFEALLAKPQVNLLQQAYADVQMEAMDIEQAISGALQIAPPLNTTFPDTWLGRQLQMVARMIAIRDALGHARQIYFVGHGDFDTHEEQLQAHGDRLAELSEGLAAFHAAMEELAVSHQVTAFTASDFGRTLSSNGKGSDHGWGSHHLVLGGAVRGGDLYGVMPDLTLDGPDDIDGGRIVPTTSVEQYTATLSKWFGVHPADLPFLFPNLVNFTVHDLGFLY